MAYLTDNIYMYGLLYCRYLQVRPNALQMFVYMSDYCTVKINIHDLVLCTIDIYIYGLFSCIYFHERPIFLYIYSCTAYFTVYIYMYRLFYCIYLHVRHIFLFIFICMAYPGTTQILLTIKVNTQLLFRKLSMPLLLCAI